MAELEGEDDLLLGALDVVRCVEALGAVEERLRGALVAVHLALEAEVAGVPGVLALEACRRSSLLSCSVSAVIELRSLT